MAQVIIVGGGFAGMTLALCLKKQSISSEIYELRDKKYSSGGNIALAPNALRVLDSLGLFEQIRTKGYNYDELVFADARGSTLGTFLNGSQQKYGFHALRIRRTTVHAALLAEVSRQQIPIYNGKKCTKIDENTAGSGNNFTVHFSDGTSASADYVVGADGMHSTVRASINSAAPTYSGLTGIMGHVDRDQLEDVLTHDKETPKFPCMLFGESGSFAIMPSSYSGDEIGYFASIEIPDKSREEWAKLSSSPQLLRDILDEHFRGKMHWPLVVQKLIEKTPVEELSAWPFYSAPTLKHYAYSRGHVILIGDSAHAIPPTGGQGAAMALEDASTLSYALALALAPADIPSKEEKKLERNERLLRAWETHRIQRIAKVMDFTSKNGRLRLSSAHYIEQAAKEWVIWIAFKWMGEEGGARWMYEYAAEKVRGDLT